MNAFFSLLIYMIIGGLLASAVINESAKECGPQTVENKEFVAMVIAWPAYITAAIAIDDSSMKKTKCGKPVESAK